MIYRKEFLVPTQYQWIDNLKMFLNHFYTKENRTPIRIYAVSRTMKEIYEQHGLVLLFNIFIVTGTLNKLNQILYSLNYIGYNLNIKIDE